MSILETAIQNLQDDMRTIPGIRQAPYAPPDNIQGYPFCTAYAGAFRATIGQPSQMYTMVSTIVLHLHVSRADLEQAYRKSIGYPEAVTSKLLANPTLDGLGTIVADDGSIEGDWTSVTWSEDTPATIAWEIRFPFKIQST